MSPHSATRGDGGASPCSATPRTEIAAAGHRSAGNRLFRFDGSSSSSRGTRLTRDGVLNHLIRADATAATATAGRGASPRHYGFGSHGPEILDGGHLVEAPIGGTAGAPGALRRLASIAVTEMRTSKYRRGDEVRDDAARGRKYYEIARRTHGFGVDRRENHASHPYSGPSRPPGETYRGPWSRFSHTNSVQI